MFSQTVEYALRAMMHIASLGGAAASSEKIAAQTRVPAGYLCKVMRDLVVGGLVSSSRGPGGGFALARAPGTISILDIVSAVDPIRRIDRCPIGHPGHTQLCTLHQRLDDALAVVERTLRGTSLAEMLRDERATNRCGALVAIPTGNGAPEHPGHPHRLTDSVPPSRPGQEPE